MGRSLSVQLASASFLSLTVGNILWLFLVAVDVLAQAEPVHVATPKMVYFSLMISLAFFSLPLMWWMNKVGFYVAIVIAAVSLLTNVSTIASTLQALAVPENLLTGAVGLVLSLVLLVSSSRASREKT